MLVFPQQIDSADVYTTPSILTMLLRFCLPRSQQRKAPFMFSMHKGTLLIFGGQTLPWKSVSIIRNDEYGLGPAFEQAFTRPVSGTF